MAAAGLKAVKYGIESAEDSLLSNIGKDLDLQKAIDNVLITKEQGIKVHLTFMFGIPGETQSSINKTIKLAIRIPNIIFFIPHTPLCLFFIENNDYFIYD